MNLVPPAILRPGTVLRVRSTHFAAVMHWGVVGYGKDSVGCPMIWHSQKSDCLRLTDFQQFSAGQSCEVLWVPSTAGDAFRVIQRLESKQGLRWHLTQANCEMAVRWAVENKPVSEQLTMGVIAATLLASVLAVAISRA